MGVDARLSFAGLAVGFLIGLTGVGSGALLAPLLIFMGIPPITVVGSDLTYALVTKLAGAGVHLRHRTVNWRWVGMLAAGSIPGALSGSLLLERIAAAPGFIRSSMGAVLVAAAALTLLMEWARRRKAAWVTRLARPKPWVISLVGFVIGLAVGVTSVGSGSLIDLALILLSPLAAAEIVGTGLVHAVILSTVATGAHWGLGNVDLSLVANLLVGSLPGVLLGSWLAFRSPAQSLKVGVTALVLFSGVTMI